MTDPQDWMKVDQEAMAQWTEELRTDVPHAARIYDYHLRGKTNYHADRVTAQAAEAAFPLLPATARINRGFMHRAVARLAEHEGVRQFLDIGTGIPTSPNVHEVVQAIAPGARVVYTDNDPIVLAHARALLVSSPLGRTSYIHADIRGPQGILHAPELNETLDLRRPVAMSMVGLLHFISDEDKPEEIVAELMDALAPGSFFIMTHVTDEFTPMWRDVLEAYRQNGAIGYLRGEAELTHFFDGLDMLEPGLVPAHTWWPAVGDTNPESDAQASLWAAVARKP